MTAFTVAAMVYFLNIFIMRKLLLLQITDDVNNHHPNCCKKNVYGTPLIYLQFFIP